MMRRRWIGILLGGAALSGLLLPEDGTEAAEVWGEAAVESRGFMDARAGKEGDHAAYSARFSPEFLLDWSGGEQRLAASLFGRLESDDDARTHADVRELYWRGTFGGDLDLYLGIRRVFWGVTETLHLVDVVNQTDLVENPDGEDKLGQPMIAATWVRDWGNLEVLVLPGFRERTFPGRDGRLRPPLPVDTEHPVFAPGAGDGRVDLALRWSHYLGAFDLGVAHFSGTDREPRLIPRVRGENLVLVPYYDRLHQTGLDVQYTRGDWAAKMEAVARERDGSRSTAAVAGFEYTKVGILGSAKDLGLILEYQYDDGTRPTAGDHDLAVGGRLTFNDIRDTGVLAFAAIDTGDGSIFASVEGSRRLGDRWTLGLETRLFLNTAPENPLHGFRDDSYGQLELIRYF